MNKLSLMGKIKVGNDTFEFTFQKGILRLSKQDLNGFGNIRKLENEMLLDSFYGTTNSGQFICFLEVEQLPYSLTPAYSPRSVIVSNQSQLQGKKFNSIRLTGGSINRFGDLIKEIFQSPSYKDDLEDFEKGLGNFSYKSYDETSLEFKDVGNSSKHNYKFSINRHFLLDDETINNFNRNLIYRTTSSFEVTEVINQFVEMVNFIKLLSWENSISIEKVDLGVTREDGLNQPEAIVFLNLPDKEITKKNFGLDIYKNDRNSIGKLYHLNKELEKSHLFLLESLHRKSMYDSKDILNSVINFEQIIDHLNIKKKSMRIEEKNLRKTIIKQFSEELEGTELYRHIINFRGNPLKDTISDLVDSHLEMKNSFILNTPNIDNNKLDTYINNTINFRNEVAHSSNFNIEDEGIGTGAFFFTYMSYYLILIKAEYTDLEAIKILKAIFRFRK